MINVIWVLAIAAGIVLGAITAYFSAHWTKGMITKAGRSQDTGTVIAMGVLGGLAGFITGFLCAFLYVLSRANLI